MDIVYALVDGSSDAILIADALSGDIVYANHAAAHLFECDDTYLIGKHMTQLHPADELEEIMQKFAAFTSSDDYKETTAHIVTQTGKRKLVLISSARNVAVRDKRYAFAYFKDITFVEKIQDIAFDQSHMVRRHLANILGLTGIIAEDRAVINEQPELLRQLHDEAILLDIALRSVSLKTRIDSPTSGNVLG